VLAGSNLSSKILILLLVLIADVSSALGVVYTQHQSRLLAVELDGLETIQDENLAEWSRLQIEQGWLADASQIEKTARGVLQMQQPGETRILVVHP
jgi:cell division protein FtsL